ncbi:unnamed protein product [Meganyctiphanes norvegica]|uniref:Phosphoinositide phospholipase C n=1 Tax=Meganyctiphanes norvegica TaxID=48144 RepID=A0AAV2RDU8_MEGNR
MTKYFDFKWRLTVDPEILEGDTFDRWTEEKEVTDWEPDCVFKVDEYGFFVYWKGPERGGDCLELTQVSDIRRAKLPKNAGLADKIVSKHGKDVEQKMLAFCQGENFVDVHLTNIICKDKAEADRWQASIRKVTNKHKMANVCPRTNMMKHWYRIGFKSDVGGKIPVKNVVKTFASGKTEKLVYSSLAELGLPSEKGCTLDHEAFTFEKFYKMYETICPRTDIDELFRKITKHEVINMEQMITFMNEMQRDPNLNQVLYPMYDEKRCMEIITAHEPDKSMVDNKKFSKQGLLTFLMSDENAPVFLDRLDVYQDMTYPMSHYLINSSHNTYLSGKQFGGKSTAEMYDQSLLSGCRCVELDCWDGKGLDEVPIITHGKAMCTEILAEEAFHSIGTCAFITSDYPVVLSFENHCCKKQQLKLAEFCKKYFGDDLLDAPIAGHPLGPGNPLPPPIKLKRKILIKNKRLKADLEKAELEIFKKGGELKEEAKEDASEAAAPKTEEAAGPEGGPPKPPAYSGTSLTNIHPWLSSMVNYAQPVHFNGFDVAEEKNIHHNMSSFSESAGLAYLKSQAVDFVNYNKRQMSRIYPKGARVDSSNYMPQIFWNAGCHMVSLNFQTPTCPCSSTVAGSSTMATVGSSSSRTS